MKYFDAIYEILKIIIIAPIAGTIFYTGYICEFIKSYFEAGRLYYKLTNEKEN